LKFKDLTNMKRQSLIKFSSRAAPEALETLDQISEAEGRQFLSILDEALRVTIND